MSCPLFKGVICWFSWYLIKLIYFRCLRYHMPCKHMCTLTTGDTFLENLTIVSPKHIVMAKDYNSMKIKISQKLLRLPWFTIAMCLRNFFVLFIYIYIYNLRGSDFLLLLHIFPVLLTILSE